MIFSMTGFATAATELDTGSLAVELRAVNHRYLDLQLRMPDELRMLEPMLREILAAQLTRGKVECRIGFAPRPSVQNPAQLNQPLVQQLAQWSDEVQAILPEADGLSVADVLRWNGVLQSAAILTDTLQTMVPELLHQVLREFTAARGREGEKLQEFLLQRIEQVEILCTLVSSRIPTVIAAYEEKLAARLRIALQTGDDERLWQEITLFASKIDVDEEVSRASMEMNLLI